MTSLRALTLLLVLSVVLVYVTAAVLPSNTTTTTKAPPTTKPKTTKAPRTTKTTTTKAPKTTKTTTTKAPLTTKTTTTKAPRTTKTTTTKKTQLMTNPETTTTTTTPKPTNCEDLVNPADSNSCLFCWCFEGEYQCSSAPCVRPMCVDSVSLPGACCPVCPNGDNCEVNGNIIHADQTVSIEGIGDCYCVMDGSYGMRAECVPVTPPMTTPNACDENLDTSNPCYKCTCENNEKQCYYIDCFFDPCVDGYYEPGVCCKICPNGRNCAVGGTIIPDGTSVAVVGYGECYCSMDYNTFRLSAACTPQTPPMTTPWLPSTPGCDETIDNSDPCFVCECYNNERQCYVIDCAPLGCVDGYKKPGDCCTKCPNGNNCAVDGTIIPENSRVYVEGHGECYCVINFETYRLEAECVPPTGFPHTTPWIPPSTPADCEGLTNPAAGNPCMYCYCMNGIYECIIGDCGMPRCFDSVREPGACCSTCPNGENCEYGGSIIPYGQTVEVPFTGTCTCVENHYTGELVTLCIPFEPTTPPDPPTTPTGCYDGYVDDPCRVCECNGDQLMCYNIPCAWGQCVDGYTEPGQCCPTCPNGRNCKAYGVIIPYGTPVLIEGIGYCYCVDETSTYWLGGVEVECLPLSTTPFTTPHTTPAMTTPYREGITTPYHEEITTPYHEEITTPYHEETTPVTPPQTTPATDAPWWETTQAPWEDTPDPPPQGEANSRPARSIREAIRRLMARR